MTRVTPDRGPARLSRWPLAAVEAPVADAARSGTVSVEIVSYDFDYLAASKPHVEAFL